MCQFKPGDRIQYRSGEGPIWKVLSVDKDGLPYVKHVEQPGYCKIITRPEHFKRVFDAERVVM